MAVATTEAVAGPFVTDGVTTSFPFAFAAKDASEVMPVRVAFDGAVTELADYTVTLNNPGGTVTFTIAPAVGDALWIVSAPSFQQQVTFANQGNFSAVALEQALDRGAIRDIALKAMLDRSIKVPIGATAPDYEDFTATVKGDPGGTPQAIGLFTAAAIHLGGAGFSIPDGVNVVATTGYSQVDQGAALYVYDAALTSTYVGAHPLSSFISTEGRVFRLSLDQDLTPLMFGAGSGDAGPALAAAIAMSQNVILPAGSYANSSTAVTLPFGKALRFEGSDISVSGSGSVTYNGVTIRQSYNPGSLSGWTGTTAYNMEGIAVDFGGYGPRSFGPYGLPTALNGSIKVPASSTVVPHANAVSGYVKTGSTATGGVALYGEANRTAASALVWGLNTRTQDGGYGLLNAWGAEFDMNIDATTTIAIGVEVTGGSTVTPALSIGFQVAPIGVYTSPKKQWQYAFRSIAGAAVVGMYLGPILEANSSAAQPFRMAYRNSSGSDVVGFEVGVDGSGNSLITGGGASTQLAIQTLGASVPQIKLSNGALGFFGSSGTGKPTVTGSRGGNAALASLITVLKDLGLLTDSSSA